MSTDRDTANDLAIVGMACRFPGANNPDEFWEILRSGTESIRRFTDDELLAAGIPQSMLGDPNFVKAGAPLDGFDLFDAGFFGFSPKDAAIMDPQHRVFLECAWEALERAGHLPERFEGSIGVFAGCGMNAYMMFNLLTNPELMHSVGLFLIRHTGNDKDFLATRVSYCMNLQGPSVSTQAACSTSLVATHVAGQSLLNGECDMALAGGVTIEIPHRQGYLYEEGEILSPDGHCRAFDASSEGTVFGSGAGVVVLRRLDDALADGDHIHAVIRGTAINNDGSQKVGYLAPSVDGQAKAVAEAIAVSGVEPETIGLVAAHGTGTPVGDPIEISAMSQAFRAGSEEKGYCAIGSVKPNIGHLDTAAGVASLIAAASALEHRQLPPSLHFERPNPEIDFEGSPFFVNTELREWETDGTPRRAGVNSLGVGGTNAYAILEETPRREPSGPARAAQLLVLSGRTDSALIRNAEELAEYLRLHPEANLADVAYTLQVGRRAFSQRRTVVCRSVDDAVSALRNPSPDRTESSGGIERSPDVAFLFPGGGAQYPQMARELYETEPAFREALDECYTALSGRLDHDLASLIHPEADRLDEASRELARPLNSIVSVFIVSYALARLWISWGVRPAAMSGHSLGEYVAACLSGVLSLEDALAIVILRGKIFERLPRGTMLSVPLDEASLAGYLDDELSIAAINAPELCVVSGTVEAIQRLETRLDADEMEYQRVKIDVAAHSPMLDPFLEEFRALVDSIELLPPQVPFISNLTGAWADAAEVTRADYWVRHLRQTVRFADGLATLFDKAPRLFLEVGPGKTLTSLSKQHTAKADGHFFVSSMRHPDEETSDLDYLLGAVGQLWLAGAEIDWQSFQAPGARRRVPLPTYAFEHQRYFIDPGAQAYSQFAGQESRRKGEVAEWFYRPTWKPAEPALPAEAASPAEVLLFTVDLPLAERIAAEIESSGGKPILVRPGANFEEVSNSEFRIDPVSRKDYAALIDALEKRGALPGRVLHLWNLGDEGFDTFDAARGKSFDGLLYLAQALGEAEIDGKLSLLVLANGMQQVAGEPLPHPAKAMLLGPCRVIPQEYPEISCRCIDLGIPVAGSRQERALAERLVEELASVDGDAVLAYRGPQRWVQSFEPATLDGRVKPAVREGGVWLITGGLGGIGLALAEQLAESTSARLVLVGRNVLPDREEWDRCTEPGLRLRIDAVRRMEQAGAEVMLAAADVTDRQAMGSVIRQARARFGGIHGVIHAAGFLDDGLMQERTIEQALRVLRPKVEGAMVLDSLLAEDDLEGFVLFSSVSAVAGPAGQVDYVAANAFLDAYAHSRIGRDGSWAQSIGWGPWRDVGMAEQLGRTLDPGRTGAGAEEVAQPGHPLLTRRMLHGPEGSVFATEFTVHDFWFLDEHRIRSGEALIPGAGFIELARAAFDADGGEPRPLELRDVFFAAPFLVQDEGSRELRIQLRREEGGAAEFTMLSRIEGQAEGEAWTEHVTGTVARLEPGEPRVVGVEEIRRRCTTGHEAFTEARSDPHLRFGPRWDNVRSIDYGSGEALAAIELPEAYLADLEEYRLHPAILDMATAGAQQLIPGYDPARDFFVPVSYGSLRARGALPARLFSHIRLRDNGDASTEFAEFDISILDEAGAEIVEIDGFTMKRVDAESAITDPHAVPVAVPVGDLLWARQELPLSAAQKDFLQLLDEGITPQEGRAAFMRILTSRAAPQVVVSPHDLDALVARLDARVAGSSQATEPAAPEVDTDATRRALEKHAAIEEAAVLAKRDRPGEIRLIAYVVIDPDHDATVSELRKYLRTELPAELVPANFLEQDFLPRDDDGAIKVDELEDPFAPIDDFTAPRSEMEQQVAAVWREVLGIDRVSVYDNFFDIGGHSLLSMRAANRIAKKTGARLNQANMVLLTLEQIASECDRQLGAESETPAGEAEGDASISRRLFRKVKRTVLKG